MGRLLAHADHDDGIRILSARVVTRAERRCMKKAKKLVDELRPEYKRSDFGVMVRGKYVDRLRESSNVVVLDPEVARVFPNGASVNDALRALAEIAKRAGSGPRR
jgi:hypothetical protein